MADEKSKLLTKVSPLIEGQVPDFIQADHPIFVRFLKEYYRFLESGQLTYTVVNINALKITAVSNIDGETSTTIRMTAIPSSNDIVPVRNQLLELDLVNTTITGQVDNTTTTGVGYTTTTSGTASTTSVNTTTSYPTSSSY